MRIVSHLLKIFRTIGILTFQGFQKLQFYIKINISFQQLNLAVLNRIIK